MLMSLSSTMKYKFAKCDWKNRNRVKPTSGITIVKDTFNDQRKFHQNLFYTLTSLFVIGEKFSSVSITGLLLVVCGIFLITRG